MIKIPYDIFYMSRMLKDKLVATKLEQLTKEKVERMEEQVSGPFTNLYKLSYQHTHIIDSIYLGNAYNASNFTDKLKNFFCLSESFDLQINLSNDKQLSLNKILPYYRF